MIRKLPTPQPVLVSASETPAIDAAPSEAVRLAPAKVKEAPLLPLSADRYKVQLTASADLRAKLERATELMRHRNPSGDLATIVERALDLLIADLEKEKLGKTSRSQRRLRAALPNRVTRAVRREVFARDGEQCTFRDAEGHRCPARTLLELDHVHPVALGGTSEVANLRVVCRLHNRLYAERAFGREHIERCVRGRRQQVKT